MSGTLPDYLADYADDPQRVSLPGHLEGQALVAAIEALDLNDPDFGLRLDAAAMIRTAEKVWLRKRRIEEAAEHGPPDPDGTFDPGAEDWWRWCTEDDPEAEPWTEVDVEWAE